MLVNYAALTVPEREVSVVTWTMNDLIHLNVGGKRYTTTRATLMRYPESMLGAMFSGELPTSVDEHGCYFIDRDGPMFRQPRSELPALRSTVAAHRFLPDGPACCRGGLLSGARPCK